MQNLVTPQMHNLVKIDTVPMNQILTRGQQIRIFNSMSPAPANQSCLEKPIFFDQIVQISEINNNIEIWKLMSY